MHYRCHQMATKLKSIDSIVVLHTQVLNLSGGELQRVALTLALGTVCIYNNVTSVFICGFLLTAS